jgi:hypothetical protein
MLKAITLENLQNDDNVRFRIGRAGLDDIVWQNWQEGPMYVQRREKSLPKKIHDSRRQSHNVGAIITITPKMANTAEFSADDLNEEGEIVFCCEDYYMQIDIPRA